MKKSIHNATHYTWGDNCDGWHLLESEELSVIQERMPPGTSETMHFHERAQQVFYILSGNATLEVGGESHEVVAGESLHIPAKTWHRISNTGLEDLHFLLTSQPKTQDDRIDIVDYTEEEKEAIKILNYAWLEKYFKVEPGDARSLANPKEYILDKGGSIYYARWKNEIVGTVSLLKKSDDVFEVGKMAVSEKAQGHHIGNMLLEHCFHIARQRGIKTLILYSNTSLGPAIHLYKKYGFKEVELEQGLYERADIKMEKTM